MKTAEYEWRRHICAWESESLDTRPERPLWQRMLMPWLPPLPTYREQLERAEEAYMRKIQRELFGGEDENR